MIKQLSYGNKLLRFVACDKPIVPEDDPEIPLTWAMVVVKKDDRYLLMHNCSRLQWECPGGGIEAGETVEEAATREVMEEASQHVINLQCHGVFKLYVKRVDRSEYGALYSGTFDELQPFIMNSESDRITLWHPDEKLDDRHGEISEWMITYLRSL